MGKGAPGRHQKFCPIKWSFRGCNVFITPPPPALFITTAYKLARHECIDLWFPPESNKLNTLEQNRALCDAALTATLVMLCWLCLAALQGIFFALRLSFCPIVWQWSGVINCSIKAALRIQNTLDEQPLGMLGVVQLLWRTRLPLAADNQHVALITWQMGLFIQASMLIE